jgi:hypothetical protein
MCTVGCRVVLGSVPVLAVVMVLLLLV